MANKFQLRVQERLEQEANRRQKAAKPVQKTEAEAPPPEEQRPIGDAARELPAPAPEATADYPDIGAYLRRDPQRAAKNKTFYLDGQVITALKAAAKEQGVTDSKLVNDILRKVLGV